MNNIIKKLRVFPALLVSGAVALCLTTCAGKEDHEVVIPTMEESFYDSNNEGIDDQFETLVPYSDDYIEYLNKLERMLNLIDRIQDLNENVYFDEEYDVYNNCSLMYPNESYGDPLEDIEKRVSFYEENRDRMSDEEKEIFNEKLCEDYNNIAYYLINRAPLNMENILLDLAKVVGVSTLDLDSIDDIKVYIDVHHLGLNGAGNGWYNYEDESEEKTVVFDGIDSDLYDLVSEYLHFYDNASYFPDFYNNTENVKDLVDEYRKTLTLIKNTVHNDYELVNGTFDSNQIIKIKK